MAAKTQSQLDAMKIKDVPSALTAFKPFKGTAGILGVTEESTIGDFNKYVDKVSGFKNILGSPSNAENAGKDGALGGLFDLIQGGLAGKFQSIFPDKITPTVPQTKMTPPITAVSKFQGFDTTDLAYQAEQFGTSSKSLIRQKPAALTAGQQIGSKIGSILGTDVVGGLHQMGNAEWQQNMQQKLSEGQSLASQGAATQKDLVSQSLAIQKQLHDDVTKSMAAISGTTFEQYQKGLLGGQTIQEIANAEQSSRLGALSESENQQRALLFNQNEYAQQQAQMQGNQAQLKLQQLTGARGIGGSSVEDQILNRQRSETTANKAQAGEQLGQGLTQINEEESKQRAAIEQETNQNVQQRTTAFLKAHETADQQEQQRLLGDEQTQIQQIQNIFLGKQSEIQDAVDKIQRSISGLQTEITDVN